ncbi:MAG: VTT domain-containing protein [archaeon]
MSYLEKEDKIKIGLILFALLIVLIILFKAPNIYLKAESFLKESGDIKGPLIFAGVIILLILLTPLPLSPFAFIGGIVFGHFLGFITTVLSATLGACLAFLIGRHILPNFISKKFKKNPIYRKMLEEEHKHILKFILYSRLLPSTAFEYVSYMAGTTTMEITKFTLATILGIIPLVFILSFFGKIIENYRILALILFCVIFSSYLIYKIAKHKRYYLKGY